jgi:hypothetical protein
MVDAANTTDMRMMRPTPYLLAAKKAARRARGRTQHLERGKDHLWRYIADAVDEAIDVKVTAV